VSSFWVQEHLREALELSLNLDLEEQRRALGDGNEVSGWLSCMLNFDGVG
jgi:hypothetical protein